MNKYKRLTERVKFDGVRYEDRGDIYTTCYPNSEENDTIDELAIRLCELEDKIEQGTLIELPCKVGDTIYIVGKEIEEFIVSTIEITILSCECWETNTIQFTDKNGHSKFDYFVYFGWIGKSVFFTREEAEKRLKELQE